MVRLLLFLKHIRPLLLFLAIEVVCIGLFLSDNSYQRARMVALSHSVLGGMDGVISSAGDYFSLEEQNITLLRENAELHRRLSSTVEDTIIGEYPPNEVLDYKVVRVVGNSYTKRNNFITISAGRNQGIEPDMALFNSDGIVGYVRYCSENFSVAISVLNVRDFNTSGRLDDIISAGSVNWDGRDYREVIMSEIPAHTPIQRGDTVVTTQYSNIFPEGIPIGLVESTEVKDNLLIEARVRLLADMSSLNYLYAVSLAGQREREELEALAEAQEALDN